MKNKVWILGFMIILILLSASNTSAIPTCAADAFLDSCKDCGFDEEGKMSGWCYTLNQGLAVACVGGAYPDTLRAYNKGECPKAKACVSSLKACTASKCRGTDKQKCASAECRSCYAIADRCAYDASNDCEGINDAITYLMNMCLSIFLPLPLLGLVALIKLPDYLKKKL